MFRLAGLAACAAAAMIAAHPVQTRAQDAYPSQTVKFVVPAPAGSTTDLLARTLAEQLAKRWGRGTMVENISGGAMNIGARAVARATPDGHTLLVAPPLPLSYSHLLYRDVGYEPGQFVPITLLATIPTFSSCVADSRGDDGRLHRLCEGQSRQGDLRVGRTGHDRASLRRTTRGARRHQDGACALSRLAAALTDVLNGHVDIFFDTLTTSVPLYRDKQVKIIGAADLTRAQVIPEVPTLHESGLPGYRSITWFGLVAPPGTPQALADRINRDTVEVLKSPEMQTFLTRVSLSPGALTPAETRKFFTAEAELWTKVIKEAGIELQNPQ